MRPAWHQHDRNMANNGYGIIAMTGFWIVGGVPFPMWLGWAYVALAGIFLVARVLQWEQRRVVRKIKALRAELS